MLWHPPPPAIVTFQGFSVLPPILVALGGAPYPGHSRFLHLPEGQQKGRTTFPFLFLLPQASLHPVCFFLSLSLGEPLR